MPVHFLDNVLKYRHLNYIFVSTFRIGGDIIFHLLLRFVVIVSMKFSLLLSFLSYSLSLFQFSTGQPAMQGDDY